MGTPKKPKKKTVQPIAAHSAYWRGKEWTIAALSDKDVDKLCGKDAQAGADLEKGFIVYRARLNRDESLISIFHEAYHEMFPEWHDEPDINSKSELGVGERDTKALLEAFGVDLSPLLPRKGK